MPFSARTFVLALASWSLACALCCVGARAQPLGDVVVVPFGAPDTAAALRVTPMLEAELANARFSIISLHDARDRFAARSRPPQMPTETDLDVLAREAHEAIEHVAFGRTAAAQKSVREVITRAERTLESLNRETATARQILDACLSLVRSALQSGRRDQALDQATRCRRLVPDLAPAEDFHPANVVGVLAEADNLLRRMRIGNLTVHSTPQRECAVYLNGRHLGTTPFRIDRAAAGEYRVQVECERTVGRVHAVQLGERPVELTVDSELDRAVAGEPRLSLRYPDARGANAHLTDHAAQLGRDVGVDDVVLVAVRDDRAELLRVSVAQQRLVGRAQVSFSERHGFAQPALAEAIEQLAQGRDAYEPALDPSTPAAAPMSNPAASPPPAPTSDPPPSLAVAPTDPAPVAVAARAQSDESSTRPSPRDPAATHARRLRRTAYALLGPAVALYTFGVVAEWRAQALEDDALTLAFRPNPPLPPSDQRTLRDLQDKYERMRSLRWLGVGGPVLAAASVGLLVAPRRVLPWWSYAIATAAAGLIGTGAYEIAASDRCQLQAPNGGCRRKRESDARGVLLMSAAAPLLTVPVAQLAKGYFRRGLVLAHAQPVHRGLQLALHFAY